MGGRGGYTKSGYQVKLMSSLLSKEIGYQHLQFKILVLTNNIILKGVQGAKPSANVTGNLFYTKSST